MSRGLTVDRKTLDWIERLWILALLVIGYYFLFVGL
jgi:hypothetical protein